MGYKHILLTLDGSLLAEQALRHVVLVADLTAVIHVVSVVVHERAGLITEVARSGAYFSPVFDSDLLTELNDLDTTDDAQLMRDRHSYLEKVTSELIDAGYTVTFDVRTGDVVQAIIDTAQNGFEVIVIATHGRTGFSKALLGSVAERVLNKAPCPVLLIPVRTAEPTH